MDSDLNPMERATRRLALALDALEAAVERRRAVDRTAGARDAEIQTLSNDRSRLAQELDREKARSARLEIGHGSRRGTAQFGHLFDRRPARRAPGILSMSAPSHDLPQPQM